MGYAIPTKMDQIQVLKIHLALTHSHLVKKTYLNFQTKNLVSGSVERKQDKRNCTYQMEREAREWRQFFCPILLQLLMASICPRTEGQPQRKAVNLKMCDHKTLQIVRHRPKSQLWTFLKSTSQNYWYTLPKFFRINDTQTLVICN